MSCANNNQIRLFSVGAFLVIATFLAMLFVAATFAGNGYQKEIEGIAQLTAKDKLDRLLFLGQKYPDLKMLGSEDGLYALEIFGTLVLEIAHLLVAVGFANGIVGEFLLAVCLTELIDFLLLLFGEVETFERIGGREAGFITGFHIASGSLGACSLVGIVLCIHAKRSGGDNGESYKDFLHFCN